MKLLFTIDRKNYKEGGTAFVRPSVRGIIQKNGLIAMIHSLKYGYYKLPGGGMEKGETHEETLIREVAEESGLQIIPASIRPFGYVKRIEKGGKEDIFVQENFYFFCDTRDDLLPQQLDAYEAQERFTLAFVAPDHAISANRQAMEKLADEKPLYVTMLERENRILQMIDNNEKGDNT